MSVNHVTYKTGATFCGAKQEKGLPFDAPTCEACADVVRASFGRKGK